MSDEKQELHYLDLPTSFKRDKAEPLKKTPRPEPTPAQIKSYFQALEGMINAGFMSIDELADGLNLPKEQIIANIKRHVPSFEEPDQTKH